MSDNIIYNIVKKFDPEPLIKLYKIAGWWRPEDKPSDVTLVVAKSFCFITAIRDGELIGTGRVISDGVTDAYIQEVIVDPRFRGQGVGKEMIKRLTRYCLEQNILWIGLIAEPDTENFYRPLGFVTMDKHTPMKYKND